MTTKIKNIVFDFGGVLIDWNPRHLYSKVFNDKEAMELFLREVCTQEWNEKQDGGRPFSEGIKELTEKYPAHCEEIAMFYDRWDEMIGGEVKGTSAILYELKSLGFSLYGLTNWSGEMFPRVKGDYSFFNELDGIVVSGDEKLLKPDPAIFNLLTERYNVLPEESLFIDDNPANAEAGKRLGFEVIRFESAEQLRHELSKMGLLKQ